MQRRQFNRYLISTITGLSLSSIASMGHSDQSINEKDRLNYASAGQDLQGQHWLTIMSVDGIELLRYHLPSRAHQVLKHPTQPWVLVVARRPGHYLMVIDIASGQLVSHVAPSMGLHFSGHMQISLDGRYLYTTENITSNSIGQIVVRDVENSFAVVNQFDSGGLGPHQLMLLNKGHRLVVANGGIHTQGREKLNLESMSSNLTYIDLDNGKILQQVQLDAKLAKLSIRHIDVNQKNDVLIAMQYQGDKTDIVPLVALHNMDTELRFLDIPTNDYYPLKHYCGSACFDQSGNTIAISAPRGDSILFWDTKTKQYLGNTKIRDGSGLAISTKKDQFIVSSGRGKLYEINPRSALKKTLVKTPSLQWDNHLAPIG